MPWYYPVALTAILTGMRRGEIVGLTWDRVDLNNRVIYLERTKSGRGRKIRMSADLTKVLRELESRGLGQHVFLNRYGTPTGISGKRTTERLSDPG